MIVHPSCTEVSPIIDDKRAPLTTESRPNAHGKQREGAGGGRGGDPWKRSTKSTEEHEEEPEEEEDEERDNEDKE